MTTKKEAEEKVAETTKEMEEKTTKEFEELKKEAAAAMEEAAKRLKNARSKIEGEELETLVKDMEDTLQSLVPEKMPDTAEVQEKVKEVIHDAEETIKNVAEKEAEMMQERVETVESFVADHPIASIAIAAGAGFMIGLIAAKLR